MPNEKAWIELLSTSERLTKFEALIQSHTPAHILEIVSEEMQRQLRLEEAPQTYTGTIAEVRDAVGKQQDRINIFRLALDQVTSALGHLNSL